MPFTPVFLEKPEKAIRAIATDLQYDGSAYVDFCDGDKEYTVYLLRVDRSKGQGLLMASDKGASLMIYPGTPVNKFEIARGNFPLDVANYMVVLFETLHKEALKPKHDEAKKLL